MKKPYGDAIETSFKRVTTPVRASLTDHASNGDKATNAI